MSNYLSILAQRATAAPTLRPRARSRFEEGLATDAANREQAFLAGQHAEAEAAAPPVAVAAAPQSQPQAQGVRAPAPLPPQPYAEDPSASRPAIAAVVAPLLPQREAAPVRRAETAPLSAPVAQIERVLPLAAAATPSQPAVAVARVDGLRGGEVAPPSPSLSPPLARSPLEPDGAMRQQRPALETVSRLQTPAVAAAAQQAGAEAGQGGARQFTAPPEAAPAPIEIHIGRIEVHAAGAAPVRAPAPPAPQAPATASLDDYLRERSRGGRS
ncbi:hypothetical protein HSX11_05675 [Oxalobacteraceae bacterium]|nr:hypothetical protein [Oxalobacteraceae bacterium]